MRITNVRVGNGVMVGDSPRYAFPAADYDPQTGIVKLVDDDLVVRCVHIARVDWFDLPPKVDPGPIGQLQGRRK